MGSNFPGRTHPIEEPDMNRSSITFWVTVVLLAGFSTVSTPGFSQQPTAEPSPSPSAEPAATPSASPTSEPTVTPSPEPTTRPSPATEPVTVTSTVKYQCDAGKGFIARYRSDRTVEATFGSKVLTLTPVESGSGARYTDGSVTLYTKGESAFVEVGEKRLFNNCTAHKGPIEARW